MTRFSPASRAGLAAGVFALWIATGPAPAGDQKGAPPEDKSIVPGKQTMRVENGSAFEKGTLDLCECKKLVVPESAEVVRKGAGTKVEVYVKKALNFGGRPPRPMSIRLGREWMGCAMRVDGDQLILGTFGEFSTKEGGTRVKLVLVVPEKLAVETSADLSGPKSAAHPTGGEMLERPEELKASYWYGPWAPGEGWRVLPTVPDVDHRADQKRD